MLFSNQLDFKAFGFTVLQTGEIAIWAKAPDGDPFMVFVCQQVDGKIQKLRETTAPCEHEVWGLLGVVVKGKELLAVACNVCRSVKLMGLGSTKCTEYYNNQTKPCRLCAGEAEKLWVSFEGGAVAEMDCVNVKFTDRYFTTFDALLVRHNLEEATTSVDGLCFLPAPHNAVVVSRTDNGFCRCFTCEPEKIEKKWEVKRMVHGKRISPKGLVFSPRHQVLLLADSLNSRILVLDPSSGSHLQTLPVPHEVGVPRDMCLHNEQLFVSSFRVGEDFCRMSVFSLG